MALGTLALARDRSLTKVRTPVRIPNTSPHPALSSSEERGQKGVS